MSHPSPHYTSTSDEPTPGLVTLCCAHMRQEPRHSAEMVSQAIMGTPIVLQAHDGEWYRITTPDGYEGWMHQTAIAPYPAQRMQQWRDSRRYIFTAIQGYLYEACNAHAMPVSDLVLGSILEATGEQCDEYVAVTTPDGRPGYVLHNEVADLATWAAQPIDMERLTREARMLMGTTYLWGGTSTKGVDCSGFARILYFSQGVILQRDASQQAQCGEALDPKATSYECGDLLFMGTPQGRITHVVVSLGGDLYIESSGRVKPASFNPTHPLYSDRPILVARRIVTALDTNGICRVAHHPQYFNL